ncbi:MAG: AAA family ATPase [Pirellulales bacterium]|nr:AAA family ATPase [Pirellulales bacterium]
MAMYQLHWGLRETPFGTSLDPDRFFESPTHEEALARLHFLVDQQRRLGLLLGASGSGKSLLLEVFAAQRTRKGATVTNLSLLGVSPAEMLWRLTTGLGSAVRRTESLGALWMALTDALTARRYAQVETLILLDDADQAAAELRPHLTRLVRLEPEPDARLHVVLAGRPESMGSLGWGVLELVDLRIDLEPWDQADTQKYVETSLRQAGAAKSVFAPPAVQRLQELTQGVPRYVNRLADLSLVAGAGRDLTEIDADVVDSAYRELVGVEPS